MHHFESLFKVSVRCVIQKCFKVGLLREELTEWSRVLPVSIPTELFLMGGTWLFFSISVSRVSVPGHVWAPVPVGIDVGSPSWPCPSFCTTICWIERDSTDITHVIFRLEVALLAWHKCEESTGSRVCLPSGIPHSWGKKRHQMCDVALWCGCVHLTAADVASLHHLYTSAPGPDTVMVASLSHWHLYSCHSKMKF